MENFPKCIKWANNSVEHSWRRLPPACSSQALLGVRPRPWSTPRREPAPRSPRPAARAPPNRVCASVSPCFGLSVRPSALLKPVRRMAPGPLHCYLSPAGRGHGPRFCGTKGHTQANCPVLATGRNPLATKDRSSPFCPFSMWISVRTHCFPW